MDYDEKCQPYLGGWYEWVRSDANPIKNLDLVDLNMFNLIKHI